jgi:hypothetical protein
MDNEAWPPISTALKEGIQALKELITRSVEPHKGAEIVITPVEWQG